MLLQRANLNPKQRACEVSRSERNLLTEQVLNPKIPVQKLGDEHDAKATAGGVALAEIRRQTMESRLRSGLFFCGEVLDIDGDTGGYNLQFAFSSGHVAGCCAAAEDAN